MRLVYALKSIILITLLAFSSCIEKSPENSAPAISEQSKDILESNINPSDTFQLSERAEDVALAKKVDEIISNSDLADARWGLFVVSLKDGRLIVARDIDRPFIPASIMKLLTSMVAIDKLGKDFRWQTKLLSSGRLENGVLRGDLILYGQGAPDLDDANIRILVSKLKELGVRKVEGDIVGDESYFLADNLGDGWLWNEIQWYYGAEASALSINLNQAQIRLNDGRPSFDEFIQAYFNVQTPRSEMPDSIGVKRELCQNRVYVWGTGRNLNVKIAVQNPALWAARILKEEMQRAGIQVNGDIRSVNWRTANRSGIKMANELAVIDSKPLSEIVYRMNKHSINLYAELILRTLGKKFGEFVPEDDPKFREVRTDDRAGIAVIKQWLSEHEITLHKSEALHDGSGLSRLNLLTPQTIGRALIAATKIKDSEAFLNSLPIAGKDGTMTNRLHDLSDKLMAKTGNITSVASLAGYLNLKDETLVFVVLSNNIYDSTKANELIDKVVREISLLH